MHAWQCLLALPCPKRSRFFENTFTTETLLDLSQTWANIQLLKTLDYLSNLEPKLNCIPPVHGQYELLREAITISLRTHYEKLFGVPVKLPIIQRSITPKTTPRICRAYVAHMSNGVIDDPPLNVSMTGCTQSLTIFLPTNWTYLNQHCCRWHCNQPMKTT